MIDFMSDSMDEIFTHTFGCKIFPYLDIFAQRDTSLLLKYI